MADASFSQQSPLPPLSEWCNDVEGVRDRLYSTPVKLSKQSKTSGAYFGALAFTKSLEKLELRGASLRSVMGWLAKPKSASLVEASEADELHKALVISAAPGELYGVQPARVGVGLVYKPSYIRPMTFSEAYVRLNVWLSKVEELTETRLIFVGVGEGNGIMPLPTCHPVMLDTTSAAGAASDSTEPRSAQDFRAFRLHRVARPAEGRQAVEVPMPRVGGQRTFVSLPLYQEMLPAELVEESRVIIPVAAPSDEHWNITSDKVFPECLQEQQARLEARKTGEAAPESGRSTPVQDVPKSQEGSKPDALCEEDIEALSTEILQELHGLRVQAAHELACVRETDGALSRALMIEFSRIQTIIGEDLNTSLRACLADLESSSQELLRDFDRILQLVGDDPRRNAANASVERFQRMVSLKMALPMAQLDSAREEAEVFMRKRLHELSSQTATIDLVSDLTEKLANQDSRLLSIIHTEAMRHNEVRWRVLLGLAGRQPVEAGLFPGMFGALLTQMGLAPTTLARTTSTAVWTKAIKDAIRLTDGRQVDVAPENLSLPQGLKVDYERDFASRRSDEIPGLFTSPHLLPHLLSTVQNLVKPPVPRHPTPFESGPQWRTTAEESVDETPLPDEHPDTPEEEVPTPPPAEEQAPARAEEQTPEEPQSQATEASGGDPAPGDDDESDPEISFTEIDDGADEDYTPPEPIPGTSGQSTPLEDPTSSRSASPMVTRGLKRLQSEPSPDSPAPKKRSGSSESREITLPSGLEEKDILSPRYSTYSKDLKWVHEVRAGILGLDTDKEPTQEQIDGSDRYVCRAAASETEAPDRVTSFWLPILEREGLLAECPPKQFNAKEDWVPLYTPEALLRHLSEAKSAFPREKPPSLTAVVPPTFAVPCDKEFLLRNFHNRECLRRQSLTVSGKRRQVAFCPYCGVINENSETAFSHVRKHLDLIFLCGGCKSKTFRHGDGLHRHMNTCPATLAKRKKKKKNSNDSK